jgi:hypothetical protein
MTTDGKPDIVFILWSFSCDDDFDIAGIYYSRWEAEDAMNRLTKNSTKIGLQVEEFLLGDHFD